MAGSKKQQPKTKSPIVAPAPSQIVPLPEHEEVNGSVLEGDAAAALSMSPQNPGAAENQEILEMQPKNKKSRVFKTDSLAELSSADILRGSLSKPRGDPSWSMSDDMILGPHGDSSNTTHTEDDLYRHDLRFNWHELKHIVAWTILLWPSIGFVGLGIALNEGFHRFAIPGDKQTQVGLSYALAVFSLTIALCNIYKYMRIPWIAAIPTVILELCVNAATVALAHALFAPPWDPLTLMVYFSISFCVWSGVSLHFLQIIQGSSIFEVTPYLVAWSIGVASALSMAFITAYGYVTFVSFDLWYIEWIVSGLTFPALSVLVGRLLVADYISFAMLWAFPQGSSRAVMSFFSICVKVNFHLASQRGILLINSDTGFALAVLVSCVTEVGGTIFNVRVSNSMQKRAEKMSVSTSSKNLFLQWLALRSALSKEKLVLHVHDESVGEKLVVFAAVAAVILDQRNVDNVDDDDAHGMKQVLLRGCVLLVAELVQDFLQRMVLLRVGGLTVTVIKPRYLTFRENLNIVCLILMTLNLFSVSADLHQIYEAGA